MSPDELSILYVEHATIVKRYIARWHPPLPRWLSEEDLVQEVWLRALRTSQGALSLVQLIRNAVIDVLRKYGLPRKYPWYAGMKESKDDNSAYDVHFPLSISHEHEHIGAFSREGYHEARSVLRALWPRLTMVERQITLCLFEGREMHAEDGYSDTWNSICKSRVRGKLTQLLAE